MLILFWKSTPTIRLYVGIAFALYVLSDAFTFAFFYPRNEIMFETAALTEVDRLRKVWSEWNSMNWVRSGLALVGVVFSGRALHLWYVRK